jgi:hypothetical protein
MITFQNCFKLSDLVVLNLRKKFKNGSVQNS